jgi:hypothetical protein
MKGSTAMAFIKVVGMYDDPAALARAKERLKREGLANEATMRVEPEELVEDLHPPKHVSVWEKLKRLFSGDDEQTGYYAEGVRRGSQLLVVTAEEKDVERIKQILRETGAVDLRRRVTRWFSDGWQGFDPAGIAFTEEEILEERRRCLSEQEIESAGSDQTNASDRNIRVFDEATGREIGRISEDELRVLREAFEEEGPDDHDYWINPEEIDDLRCRPGATPHLIALLRAAVGNNRNGVEIAFQREGEGRESFRAAGRS